MNAEFFAAVEDIEKEKGIPRDYMYEKIEQAMLAAFRRDNPDYGENVEVILDEDKKRIELVVHKTVVEQVEDPTMEIDVDSAKKLSKRAVIGDELTQVDGELLLSIVQKRVHDCVNPLICNELVIELDSMPENPVLMGAAAIAAQQVLSDPGKLMDMPEEK